MEQGDIMVVVSRFCVAVTAVTVLASCGSGSGAPLTPGTQRGQHPIVAGESPAPFGEPIGIQAGSSREPRVEDVIDDLAGMPAPKGTNAFRFRELTAALRQELDSRKAEKLASKPPRGEFNRVDDLKLVLEDGSRVLAWSHKFPGDLNQDGIVDLKDLTPLAINLLKPVSESNEWMDTNGDGVIDFKELTAMAINFFTQVAGYMLLGAMGENGNFQEIQPIPYVPPQPPGVVQYRMPLPESGYRYFAVAPFDDFGELGEMSNVVAGNLPPVALADAAPTAGQAPLYVAFACSESYDPDGTIVRYEWDFDGDGVFDWASVPPWEALHLFGEPGEYDAVLKVTDNEGASDTDTIHISVGENQPPVAVAQADPIEGNAALEVTFSPSGSSDPDGEIVDYAWDFNADGYIEWEGRYPQPVKYTFKKGGVYKARLRVTDDKGAVDIDAVKVTVIPTPPRARLSAHPTEGRAWLEVYFNAGESIDPNGRIVFYEWDWEGDGIWDAASTRASRTHVYTQPGTYIAVVRVTDEEGATDMVGALIKVVAGYPPTINQVGPTTGLRGYEMTISADVEGTPFFSYQWEFGGGATPDTSEEEAPVIVPGEIGEYQASVTVTNDYGEATYDFTLEVFEPGPGDWAMFGRDARHTRLSPYLGTQTNAIRWSRGVGTGAGNSSPAIGADGSVYVGGSYLYAFSRHGITRWRYATENLIDSSPAIGEDGTIYVGSYDSYIYAIKPDGTLKWRYDTGGSVESSPAVGRDGTIYVGSNDGHLYALNQDGTLKWRYDTGTWVHSSPAVADDGTVYVGTINGYLYAIRASGALKWRYKTGGQVRSSPAISERGTVFVGSFDGFVYAFYRDGTMKWKFEIGNKVYASPALGREGLIYVGSWDGYLYALHDRLTDVELVWKYDTGASISSSAAIGVDGTAYVGNDSGSLYAIGLDGSLKWKALEDDPVYPIYASPAIAADGSVYIHGFWGGLYALGE